MKKILDNHQLELKYTKGLGAWTYHLVIPGTADLKGKWGSLKVSGQIDGYPLKEMNLAPRKNHDKMISINREIRTAIGKTGGEMVTVTLYLHAEEKLETEADILQCFHDAGVLQTFKGFNATRQQEILGSILSKKTEEQQINQVNLYVEQFMRKGQP